jgi:hypothetical protein
MWKFSMTKRLLQLWASFSELQHGMAGLESAFAE